MVILFSWNFSVVYKVLQKLWVGDFCGHWPKKGFKRTPFKKKKKLFSFFQNNLVGIFVVTRNFWIFIFHVKGKVLQKCDLERKQNLFRSFPCSSPNIWFLE